MKYGAYEKARLYTLELGILSDDYVYCYRRLSEIYDDVSKEVDCMVRVIEFHFFPDNKKEVILKWLNKEDPSK